jgi:hypothetical protein
MTWIPDSGATMHTTYCRELFTNYTPDNSCIVKMENTDIAHIIRRGHVHLETENGTPQILKLVIHVKVLQLNIISVRLLDEV